MRLRLPAALAALALAVAVAPAATAKPPHPGPAADSTRAAASAVLDTARAVMSGHGDGRSATLALRDLWAAMDDLSTADRTEAESLLARPTIPTKLCQATICVHYTTSGGDAVDPTDVSPANGVPDYVDLTLATVVHIHDVYVGAGYREPLPDGGTDGTNQLDVYLEDDGADGLYGYCAPDQDTPQGVYTSWSYCSFDNDFSPLQFGTANTPTENLQVTAAHEYFHATQFAYDAYEDRWLLEATATWAEDELYPDVNDNLQYLPDGPIGRPDQPLDLFPNGCCHQYGTWIFFRYLSEKYTTEQGGLPTIVREIWERLDAASGGPDDDSTQGVSRVLADHGSSFAKTFGVFSVFNQFPAAGYGEGDLYPTAPSKKVTVSGSSKDPSAFARTLDHMSSSTVRYVPSGLTQSNWRLGLAFDLADKAKGSAALVTTVTTSGSITYTFVKLNSSGNFKGSVPFSSSTVAAVYVTLLNASSRFDCWTHLNDPPPWYTCFGTPRDDNLKQKVDPVAFRS